MRVFSSPYCYTTSLPSKVTADGWGWGVGGGRLPIFQTNVHQVGLAVQHATKLTPER